jgi:methionyl-tRNA synthetase
LGASPAARTFRAVGESGALVAGTALPPPSGIFPRFVEADSPAS